MTTPPGADERKRILRQASDTFVARQRIFRRAFVFILTYMMEMLLGSLVLYLAVTTPNFFSLSNAVNVLRAAAPIGIIAFGMTMVIISAEIDLSVGSAVSFAACLTAYLTQHLTGIPMAWRIPLAGAASMACGFAFGTFTGIMRTKFRVPTFITTLALMTGLSGAALKISGGFPLTPFPQWFSFLGSEYVPVLIFLFVFLTIHFLMNYTTFGRSVYAVGGNAEAARLCGINVGMVRALVLAITGMLAALSGIVSASRVMAGTPKAGEGWELDVIAAVIVGGTNITGGSGRIWGTLIGVIFIGVISNGLTMKGVAADVQYIVKGTIILAAVLLSRLQQRKG